MVPTYHGFVSSTRDAAHILEGCLCGELNFITQRPLEKKRKREGLIQSGSIFCFEEKEAGIKRWTDGLKWSPSRGLGNSFLYRELVKRFPPGEKMRARKRSREDECSSNSDSSSPVHQSTASQTVSDEDRKYIGALVDSYEFKKGGLMKKTFTFAFDGNRYHVICYYLPDDAKDGRLMRPILDSMLSKFVPRREIRLCSEKAGWDDPEDMFILPYAQQLSPHPQPSIPNLQQSIPSPQQSISSSPVDMYTHPIQTSLAYAQQPTLHAHTDIFAHTAQTPSQYGYNTSMPDMTHYESHDHMGGIFNHTLVAHPSTTDFTFSIPGYNIGFPSL